MLLSLLQNDNFEKILVQFQKEFHSNVLLLPLYTKPIDLCATYIDGSKGVKEHLIPCENKKIKDVFYNEKLKLTKKVIHSIKEAEYIIIGPGSLYTSVGAVLTDKTVARLVKNSSAKTIYICNIMTEPKETDDYSVLDHVRFIESKIGKSLDYIIANKKELNNIQKEKYASKNASPVKIVKTEKNIMYRNLLDIHQEYVRHDSKKLKKIIKKIIDN